MFPGLSTACHSPVVMYVSADEVEPLMNLLEKAVPSVKSVDLLEHGLHMILGLCSHWSSTAFLDLQFPLGGNIHITERLRSGLFLESIPATCHYLHCTVEYLSTLLYDVIPHCSAERSMCLD